MEEIVLIENNIINDNDFCIHYPKHVKVLELKKNEEILNMLNQFFSSKEYLYLMLWNNKNLNVPPVFVFLKIFEKQILEFTNGEGIEDPNLRQAIGAAMGWYYRFKIQKKLTPVKTRVPGSLLSFTYGASFR